MPNDAPAHQPAYSAYPVEYFTILDKLDGLGVDGYTVGPFIKKDAFNGRRSFYQFRLALKAETGKGDRLADDYYTRASLLKLEVTEAEDGLFNISFTLNPIVAAVRRMEATQKS